MKKYPMIAMVVAVTWMSAASAVAATTGAHWGYYGNIGPAYWGSLDPAYATCSEGKEQSPIDLRQTVSASSPTITVSYGTNALDVFNNGHTIQADILGTTRSILLGTAPYNLVQFHFHTPSEHTVRGGYYPMELHLVHKDAAGKLTVIGVFIVAGAYNAELDKIFARLPAIEGQHVSISAFDLFRTLPPFNTVPGFYHYAGSLTTPKCTQAVKWSVIPTPITMSSTQISRFVKIFSGAHFPAGNARPPQPLNARTVYYVGDELD